MEVLKGIPVSSGVVVGRAFVLDDVLERVPYHQVPQERVEEQLQRFETAVNLAIADLEGDRDRARETLGPEPAKIFEFHLGLLHDETLLKPVREHIETERVTAAYAVAEAFRSLAVKFRKMGSEVLRQKANDVLDLDRRLLGKLMGQSPDELAEVNEPVVVICHNVTPTQAANFDKANVIGLATDVGGRTDHSSIVAAALGIPVVVGTQRVSVQVEDGDTVIVDGKSGVVIVRPDDETISSYRQRYEQLAGLRAGIRELAELEPSTLDGTRIELMGNIEFAREIDSLLENGGDGVGLYRTEFLYLTSVTEPTEQEHYEAYRSAIELLEGRPLVLRTLDLGADKYTQQQSDEPERNPFLGLRSIRYCLQNLPMFKTQLRAILRASVHGPVKVMFPLISTANELRQAKMILNDVMEEMDEQGEKYDPDIPIGIMIEVPSAALMAPVFAREVAFFSIGTNDLIQYTLAVDRSNERVANLYSGGNPAVIKMVKDVIRAGKRFDIDVSLCGEMAGEVTFTMLLIGLGLRTLSLVPSQIPYVKRVIRSVTIEQCERLARKVGSFDSERQVMNCLREELRKIVPDLEGGWSAG